ncbi:hypothetical protein F2P45_11005 [Massilia sp. CCM 8733]|uniref:Uncharacterized protein n=1 Tax=Massilia mucilaginosa TaxID=2609282 RepID=A0ABX0NRK7_9BURK|nr:hypothetical protein [Massilia mucilaginosa]
MRCKAPDATQCEHCKRRATPQCASDGRQKSQLSLVVAGSGHGLVPPSPERPPNDGDQVGGHATMPGATTVCESPARSMRCMEPLPLPLPHRARRQFFLTGAEAALAHRAARYACASIASVMCRYPAIRTDFRARPERSADPAVQAIRAGCVCRHTLRPR